MRFLTLFPTWRSQYRVGGHRRCGMKNWLAIAAISILAGGCSNSSKRETFGDYIVEFPDAFQEWSTRSPAEKRWATQDGTLLIDAFTETRPREDFNSLPKFETWLESQLGILRPNFFRAASGTRMALSTTEDQSQIVIIHPSNGIEWRATVFRINRGDDINPRVREIRELAIAAITSGRFTPR